MPLGHLALVRSNILDLLLPVVLSPAFSRGLTPGISSVWIAFINADFTIS